MVEQIRFSTMKHQEVCLNAYHISGERVCKKMKLKVRQQFCCRHWQMSDGLKNAGLQNGGVVRQRGTQEIIIK